MRKRPPDPGDSARATPATTTHAGRDEAPWPNPVYAWYVVGVLFTASTFSFVDRQILSLLVEEIKRDLGISEVAMGWLHGLSFTLFYTLAAFPIAALADRRSRRTIISAGVAVWSFATMLCGVAGNFWQLFFARFGVGAGEGTLGPCAYSLISDYFPREKLSLAMSLFAMGNLTGAGLSFMIGGAVSTWAETLPAPNLPLIGEIYSWQLTFFFVGLPGLIFALLIFTVKEPIRRGSINPNATASQQREEASFRAFFAFIREHWQAFGALFASFMLLVLVAYANFNWIPTFYRRVFDWDKQTVGLIYGGIVAVFGTSGAVFGGWLANRFAKKGRTDGPFRATFWCTLPLAPLAVLAFIIAPTGNLSALFFIPWQFFGAVPAGLAGAAMMSVTPNAMRGKITAMYLFITNIIGMTLGPVLVSVFTEVIFADLQMIGYSLAVVACLTTPTAAALIFWGMKHYRATVATLEN